MGTTSTNSRAGRAKSRTLKVAGAVFGAFLTTATPYVVLEMVEAYGDVSSLDENFVAWMGIFCAANSSINPLIYLFFSTDFCKDDDSAGGGLCCCCCCCCWAPVAALRRPSRTDSTVATAKTEVVTAV